MGRLFEEYNKATLRDVSSRGNDIEAEINFDKRSDVVKLTLGDKQAVIPTRELHALVWAIADEEQRDRLIPVKQTRIGKIMKTHKVKVIKDIRKGEFLNVRCETNIPLEMMKSYWGETKDQKVPIIKGR